MIINKSCCKIAVSFIYISILSSDIPLDFYDSIQAVPVKYLMYFVAGINTK